ncbi:MAG: hypothetical protein KJ788_11815 [Gammaproteobacteria bacterium]|nr:hypothetical protein [Gammaproteobacteria bacterium]
MSKLILFLLVAVIVYVWLKRSRSTARPSHSSDATKAETMVSCAYCGLHVPKGECVSSGDRCYCGEEHRRLDSREQRD